MQEVIVKGANQMYFLMRKTFIVLHFFKRNHTIESCIIIKNTIKHNPFMAVMQTAKKYPFYIV
jgi:hypothetical protein